MVKLQKISANKNEMPNPSRAVKESAQQIWLAGLGAFSKAQEGGGKVFESLMKEGLSIQRKTQAVAEEKISAATSKISDMATMAGGIQSSAGQQWDKLENIFEDRVVKALNKLGVPSEQDMHALVARLDELNKTVQKISSKAGGTAHKTAPAKAPAAKKVPSTAKKVAKPAVKRASVAKRKPVAKSI